MQLTSKHVFRRPTPGTADTKFITIEGLEKQKRFMRKKLECLKQENDRLRGIIDSKRNEIKQQIEQMEVVCPSLDGVW